MRALLSRLYRPGRLRGVGALLGLCLWAAAGTASAETLAERLVAQSPWTGKWVPLSGDPSEADPLFGLEGTLEIRFELRGGALRGRITEARGTYGAHGDAGSHPLQGAIEDVFASGSTVQFVAGGYEYELELDGKRLTGLVCCESDSDVQVALVPKPAAGASPDSVLEILVKRSPWSGTWDSGSGFGGIFEIEFTADAGQLAGEILIWSGTPIRSEGPIVEPTVSGNGVRFGPGNVYLEIVGESLRGNAYQVDRSVEIDLKPEN